MKKILNLLKYLSPEIVIGFIFILIVSIYLIPPKTTIKADGQGYYDYLPSIFIYKDFPQKGLDENHKISDRINNLGMYINYGDYKINKYPCGTAVLMAPFFSLAHIIAPLFNAERDGYSSPYHSLILLSAFFYLLFGLFFLRRLLQLYNISHKAIYITLILAAFGSGLTIFTFYDPSFSHIYSFFAINAFLYFTKQYLLKQDLKSFIFASVFLGLVIIIRQINVVIILFVPFLAGSYPVLKNAVTYTLRKPLMLITGVFIICMIMFLQAALWYIETGNFLIYSYQGEGFNFADPAFFKVLFSYKKGLFIYTPLMFLSLTGLYFLFIRKEFYQLFTWIGFFVLITYIISSWWSWSYAASFGLRAYVEFYSVFLILAAISLYNLKGIWKWIFLFLCLLTIPLNIIQTKQYRQYILHWGDMNKEGYWKVFLKLDHSYEGILWKRKYDFTKPSSSYPDSLSLGNIEIPAKSFTPVLIDNPYKFNSFSDINILQVRFKNDFNPFDRSKIVVSIIDTVSNQHLYYHEVPVIHFADKKLNLYQEGIYNFEFNPIGERENLILKVYAQTKKHHLKLDDFKINLLKYEN